MKYLYDHFQRFINTANANGGGVAIQPGAGRRVDLEFWRRGQRPNDQPKATSRWRAPVLRGHHHMFIEGTVLGQRHTSVVKFDAALRTLYGVPDHIWYSDGS